jgi:hypothetical protein
VLDLSEKPFAGRDISAMHEALGPVRVMRACGDNGRDCWQGRMDLRAPRKMATWPSSRVGAFRFAGEREGCGSASYRWGRAAPVHSDAVQIVPLK